ncbi:methyltransferase domain-containing protein [Pontibacillus yanchengensis]|uniref:Methyltransferase domain-containing protein n=1 Tax=Pontibacillus yanchengensis TaxID=462910 RepID=A0ACC7VH91_9BACI|nr:class I SAM-dependent methyltransferase [Pontibacillus yanchengensis]MYL54152.1 methyltransferase domain-containing protein [Pontibacillus yanchengensis]
MEYRGSTAYDDDEFFAQFLSRRNRENSPNNIIEKPVLLHLIGDVSDKRVLDIGCGDASFAKEINCAHYDGVEGSYNMVKAAKENVADTDYHIYHSSMEQWDYPVNTYDVIVSRLAFHYIEHLDPIFHNIYHSLKEGGEFIFSVQHPVLTSSSTSATGSKQDWRVDDYFYSGERIEPWIQEEVVKYHRTIEEYFSLLMGAGFKVCQLKECTPEQSNFASKEEYERRMRIPLFLMFACVKKT